MVESCNVMPFSCACKAPHAVGNTDCFIREEPSTHPAMNQTDEPHPPEEHETVKKLKEAYMQDEGLPEDLAEARAKAEVNRLAGRTDGSFDARPGTRDKRGGFQTDSNDPATS